MPDNESLSAGERSFTTQVTDWLAGSTDIGQRHHENQDAISIYGADEQQIGVLVVCDGVSSAPNSARASLTAANTIGDLLSQRLSDGDFRVEEAAQVFRQVFEQANAAVLEDAGEGSPAGSCTAIAAVVERELVVVANLGDTRAYWFPDESLPLQISVDDSMAQAQMEMGISREEAEAGVHAHAITKWLGPDATDLVPRVRMFEVNEPGWLMVCSDGLWNYASEAQTLGAVLRQCQQNVGQQNMGQQNMGQPDGDQQRPAQTDAANLAHALVDFANQQGGRDNISVCLARLS